MILLVKLFFLRKFLRKQKNELEVFLFSDRKLLSGFYSTMYVIAQVTHED